MESSALLAWWLGEPSGAGVQGLLAGSGRLVTSELALVECDRVFLRSAALRQVSPARLRQLQRQADGFWSQIHVLAFDRRVIESARRPFPGAPIRSLDALHLAFYAAARDALGEVALLSLDERVRAAARELGGHVVPD